MENADLKAREQVTAPLSEGDREIELFFEDLAQRQKNLLPPDLITNDRHVDDVLWHGSAKNPPIQRAGAVVIGGCLALMGLSLVVIEGGKGHWFGVLIPLVLAACGLRVVYKSFVGRKPSKANKDIPRSEGLNHDVS